MRVIGFTSKLPLFGVAVGLLISAATPQKTSGASNKSDNHTACSSLVLGAHVDLVYEKRPARRAKVVAAARSILSLRIARNTLPWDRIESERGERNWSLADAVVNELTAAHIEPLLVLMGSPSWANGMPADVEGHELYVPTEGKEFDAWLNNFARFGHDAASRYRGRVHRWEIWNEPNFSGFWRPKPNADRYGQTYRRLRAVILEADPTARVATGGLAALNVAWGGENVSGLTFLGRLVRDGVRPSLVAIHPYTTPPHAPDSELPRQNNFEDIAEVHELLLKRGIRASIWVTEWGWSSEAVGAARQASYVQRSLELLRDRYPYVTVATYFIDHDRPPRFYQGLLDASLKPKPAAARFAAFGTGSKKCKGAAREP